MIRYSLKCDAEHSFESWFASAAAFDTLKGSGMVACPTCGSSSVEKAIMAPRVTTSRGKANPPAPAAPDAKEPSAPQIMPELEKLRKHVEENSDYVGLSFASEARKMHEGETPHRPIYGEAKPQEARQLLEDGVPVAPLPFIPQRKTN